MLLRLSRTITILWASMWERSEEHTSELQSWLHLVCRLLLEKKKQEYNEEKHASFAKNDGYLNVGSLVGTHVSYGASCRSSLTVANGPQQHPSHPLDQHARTS